MPTIASLWHSERVVVAADNAPSVTGLTNDGYVVAWQNGTDGIVCQMYDAFGAAVGNPITIYPGYPGHPAAQPQVAGLTDGGFVVSWRYGYDVPASDYDVEWTRYNASGVQIATGFGSATADNEGQADIVGLSNGGFAISNTNFTSRNGDAHQIS